ncbi:3-deoxy-7-phosphoheptulonate synthase [Kangiella sp. TOML190]|uniref:3-deoxy-7-phosphoheptulonate synthase n=1 Tax=Kangiella sp. TOML190 TaxID=2931351 RepID=UPI00203ECBB0|nr:3-deoxy-7-phosphoheptulonate synthase class II [Kangiella sp. TOML190]
MELTKTDWRPDSWKQKPVSQQINYGDEQALNSVIGQLRQLPPLVSATEVDNLKSQIALAQQGKHFILQGGDCAESFADCNADSISQKVRLLVNLSLLLSNKIDKPISRIGRIAGQYAKPRSQLMETKLDETFHSYRGDLVNSIHFSESARTPDPERMLQGYSYASLTLNYIRSMLESDLDQLLQLDKETQALAQLKQSAKLHQSLCQFQQMAQLFQRFYGSKAMNKGLMEFFTSHEALHLHYEEALTRQDKDGNWYNLSTHFPWVGMRTANPDSAHIEYLRGIANPVAIKVGPQMQPQQLLALCKLLNPNNEAGRLTLIHRFGHQQIARKLPALIQAVESANHKVLWCCDPMHGNGQLAANGIKTRDFQHIQSELEQAIAIHQNSDSILGGLHLEMTAEAVMECVGSSYQISAQELNKSYTSLVDPRLNISQAFELIDNLDISIQKTSPKSQLIP